MQRKVADEAAESTELTIRKGRRALDEGVDGSRGSSYDSSASSSRC